MIDKRYRTEAQERLRNITNRSFMYGDIMEHISVERTKSSGTDADLIRGLNDASSTFTINLKLEFKSTEVDIANLEESIQKIMDTEYPGSPNS